MNITHYYLDAGHCTQPKNRLEASFVEYLKTLNGRLIQDIKLDAIMLDIKAEAHRLNTATPRCKPLAILIRKLEHNGSYTIFGCCIQFQLKPAKLWQR